MDTWSTPQPLPLVPAATADKSQSWLTEGGHAIGGLTEIAPSDRFCFGGLAPHS